MVHSKLSHLGELMVDHRASPGLPPDFYRKLGVDIPACGEGKLLEMATMTCSHCRNIVVLRPERTRERAYCRKCDHYICDVCAGIMMLPDYVHTPFEKVVDKVQDNPANLPLLLSQLKGT
jgi:hypothetical protein